VRDPGQSFIGENEGRLQAVKDKRLISIEGKPECAKGRISINMLYVRNIHLKFKSIHISSVTLFTSIMVNGTVKCD
jgi:hypothetical protein